MNEAPDSPPQECCRDGACVDVHKEDVGPSVTEEAERRKQAEAAARRRRQKLLSIRRRNAEVGYVR